ncbi:MAG TPA: hypothetical protein PKV50_05820, partial [Prolixibacteraceae bacterium]|nr:hypothetical protein [Prolixibacteraceae bacterium]
MTRTKTLVLIILSIVAMLRVEAQETYSLQKCIGFALENNNTIKKSKLERDKSLESRREILGSLLPQLSGSGSFNYNLK